MRKINQNPFVDRYDHKMIGVDRQKEVNKIIASIKATSASFVDVETTQPKVIIVRAGYGVGKTFTAFHLRKMLLNEGGYAVSFFRLIDDHAKGVRVSNKSFVIRTLNELEVHDDFRDEFVSIRNDILKQNPNDFNALIELSELLYQKQIKNLVVLIDEVEDLISAGKNRAVHFLTMLRNLYDSYVVAYSKKKNVTPISIMLFLSPDAWDVIMMNGDRAAAKNAGAGLVPLIDRIGNQIYNLREFDKNDLEKFIVMMLNKVSDEADDISPFSADVIDRLYTITRGNPRRIITHCHSLVQRMLDASKAEVSLSDFMDYCQVKDIEIEDDTSSDDEDEFYGKF